MRSLFRRTERRLTPIKSRADAYRIVNNIYGVSFVRRGSFVDERGKHDVAAQLQDLGFGLAAKSRYIGTVTRDPRSRPNLHQNLTSAKSGFTKHTVADQCGQA
jgi:hypothetical protein